MSEVQPLPCSCVETVTKTNTTKKTLDKGSRAQVGRIPIITSDVMYTNGKGGDS